MRFAADRFALWSTHSEGRGRVTIDSWPRGTAAQVVSKSAGVFLSRTRP